ncbi:MAG: alkaline phosphatase family protein, partial [Opitutales bacterium]
PTLTLVYLPHLDYNLQRYGEQDPRVHADLAEIDEVLRDLIGFFTARGVEVVVLSEYGITDVDRPVHVNRALREAGWLAIREESGWELLDAGASQAFAVADHQIAHVYVKDPVKVADVVQLLEKIEGVGQVLHGDSLHAAGLDHPRAGEVVAIAEPHAWFTYYYWMDDQKAPDFARCVDIHRKYGFDPVELFIDPNLRFPKLHLARRLLQKKLGFRMRMDVIPLDAELVCGSHGHLPTDSLDWPVLLGDFDFPDASKIAATDVHAHLLSWCL